MELSCGLWDVTAEAQGNTEGPAVAQRSTGGHRGNRRAQGSLSPPDLGRRRCHVAEPMERSLLEADRWVNSRDHPTEGHSEPVLLMWQHRTGHVVRITIKGNIVP